jgi:hypothetical protein
MKKKIKLFESPTKENIPYGKFVVSKDNYDVDFNLLNTSQIMDKNSVNYTKVVRCLSSHK